MSKKIISVLLAVVMVLAMGTVAMVSVSANIDSLPAVADGCYRYYFFMPDQWVNDYAYTAGIYWWEGTDACASWPGYEAIPTGYSTEGGAVYYYDVPTDVTTIIWNNYFDGGSDATAEFYKAAVQTFNIGSEFYDVDESKNIPEGTDDFNGMIFITDVNKIDTNPLSGKQTFGGEWAYYYGNGEWGFSAVKGEKEVFNIPAIGWTPDWTVPDDTGAASGDEPAETEPVESTPVSSEVVDPTEPVATEATEATEPPVTVQNIVLDDGAKYPYTTGDTVTYTVELTADKLFENIQGALTYDASVLELQRVKSEDPDIADYIVEGPAYCPNLSNGIVLNAAEAGVVNFNASNIAGYNFKESKTLITLTFNVIGEGDTAINLAIDEMTKMNGESYFTNGEQVTTEGIALTYSLTGNTEPTPTEPVETKP
ncbi:MAG: cohesin domain-containing protein, partial [Eubacteriales bacterium]|nr:cohesin domain-containing protein [Eubacteriales bacterium]